jgi:hypothetical protein
MTPADGGDCGVESCRPGPCSLWRTSVLAGRISKRNPPASIRHDGGLRLRLIPLRQKSRSACHCALSLWERATPNVQRAELGEGLRSIDEP